MDKTKRYLKFLLDLKKEETIAKMAFDKLADNGECFRAYKKELDDYVQKNDIDLNFNLEGAKNLKKFFFIASIIVALLEAFNMFLVCVYQNQFIMSVLAVGVIFLLFILDKYFEFKEQIEKYNKYLEKEEKTKKYQIMKIELIKNYYKDLSDLEMKLANKLAANKLLNENISFLFMYGSEDINNTKIFDDENKKKIKQNIISYWEKKDKTLIEDNYLVKTVEKLDNNYDIKCEFDRSIDDLKIRYTKLA